MRHRAKQWQDRAFAPSSFAFARASFALASFALLAQARAQPAQPQPPPPQPAPPQPAPPPQPVQPGPPQQPLPPPKPAPEANWAPPLPAEAPPPSEPAPPADGEPEQPVVEGSGSGSGMEEAHQVEPPPEPESDLEVYGFAMLDVGYDFGHVGDPAWEDTERPTKLPAFKNEFGKGGRSYGSVKQTRFGVKGTTPTAHGDIETKFEFELFGTGVDAGQTTFRLRHAYGTWQHLTAGQTWSPFMDPDVFPDSIEYWGPNGMVFFRNVQLSYKPWVHDDSYGVIALERPGASADTGNYAERVELENVVARFPAPDMSGNLHIAGPWGHVQLAGMLRYIRWDDLAMSPTVEGHVWGWGVNLSTNIKIPHALIKLQGVYGEAIENYMNDAGADVGPKASNNAALPIDGAALPVLGLVGFVDIKWCELLTSSVGWSYVRIDNSAEQAPEAFHVGHYALGNVLVHPSKPMFFGAEFQFGRRENNSDGFTVNDYKLQFSFKYNFSQSVGGAR